MRTGDWIVLAGCVVLLLLTVLALRAIARVVIGAHFERRSLERQRRSAGRRPGPPAGAP